MAAPKIPMPGPPSFGSLKKGAKLTVADMTPILLGAVPLTPEVPAPAIDVVVFAPCPAGRLRVVVRGFAWDGDDGSLLAWRVIKVDGTEIWLDIAGEGAETIPLHNSTNNLRPVTLEEGDFLQVYDDLTVGGTIFAGIGFVDVEVR